MSVAADSLHAEATRCLARRIAPSEHLATYAEGVARACYDMAARFTAGGKLLVFGNGGPATDAQHIAVEFIHPVIVGKRALPALSLVSDVATVMGIARQHGIDEVFTRQVEVLGTADDIALGVSADGNCVNVLRGLEAASAAGLLTVALVGGDGGAIAVSPAVDHCFVVDSDDPHIVKEVHVTTYHVLWELVHVFFESPSLLGGGADDEAGGPSGESELGGLYPFLYDRSTSLQSALDSVAKSTLDKVNEIVELRSVIGRDLAGRLAACAAAMAEAFRTSGKVMAFGNGGSSTDAQDVVHTFFDPPAGRPALPALCLTNDAAVVTALSNDVGFDVVFARQIAAFGRPGDVALGISTSGGSANVLAAFERAKQLGLVTVGLSGYGGGKMAELDCLDFLFAIPSSSVHRVQEVQTTLYHVLWELTQFALAQSDHQDQSAQPDRAAATTA